MAGRTTSSACARVRGGCGSVRPISIETRNVTMGGDQCCGVRRLMCLADVDQHSTTLHGICIGEADAAMTCGDW